MGRPPTYVFVVRHGNRLDAADKQWHLSSPTPYDPPLTYGGWMQSRAVGARIASILQQRDNEQATESPTSDEAAAEPRGTKQKKYNIVIHSSPFLRCVQTSIAISAGLASTPTVSLEIPEPQPRLTRLHHSSSMSGPVLPRTRTPTTPEHAPSSSSPHPSRATSNPISKSILRLDPFLGEWLTPDYFEHITPPPESSLMLVTAKAELLRKEDYHTYSHFTSRPVPTSPSQLWNASPPRGSPLASAAASGLEDLTGLAGKLPSAENGDSSEHSHWKGAGHRPSLSEPIDHTGYRAPVPSFAISPSEPIPQGYVAHARDACVNVDYQWDSTRDELGWGDGGTLPEEWAAMHQRFRRGLKRLVEWYATAEAPGEMVTKSPLLKKATPYIAGPPGSANEQDVTADDTENIVILVSHGAGCNALTGGITHQPVLADVPMSSLTVAQIRPEFYENPPSFGHQATAASLDDVLPRKKWHVSEIYELKMFADTEHLHSGRTTPSAGRSASAAGLPPPGPRGRFGPFSALKEINFGAHYGEIGSPGVSRSSSANASLGSIRRSPDGSTSLAIVRPIMNSAKSDEGLTIGSGYTSFSGATRISRSGSSGLWAPVKQEEPDSEEPPMTLDFSYEKTFSAQAPDPRTDTAEKPPKSTTSGTGSHPLAHEQTASLKGDDRQHPGGSTSEELDTFPSDDEAVPSHLWAGTGNGGLWGAPRPPGEAERSRDFTVGKRRWTVNERG